MFGLYDYNVQKRLLSEKDSTATKSFATAAAWEMAKKNEGDQGKL